MQIDADGMTIPYREALRAIGWQFDTERLIGLRLDMRGQDLVIEAHPLARPGHVERVQLTPAEVLLFRDAERRRRGQPAAALSLATHPGGLGYQEVLRVLGQELDRRGIRLTRVIEHADGLIVQSLPSDTPDAALSTELLRWETMQVQHERAIRHRGMADSAER